MPLCEFIPPTIPTPADRFGLMLFKLNTLDPKLLKDRIKNHTSYTGTYFYILHLKAPKQIEQGYIYLIKK